VFFQAWFNQHKRRTFGEFNVVAVCTVLDVVAMLLMTIPGITLHQIYAVPNLDASFEKREEKEDIFEDV